MKVVLNKDYGGFGLSDKAYDMLGIDVYGYGFDERDKNFRSSSALIDLIKQEGVDFVEGEYASLKVIELPDEITDWEINEYDGWETITAVLDGKLIHR